MRRLLPFVAWILLATCAGIGSAQAQPRNHEHGAFAKSRQEADDAPGPLVRFLRGRLVLHLNAAYRTSLLQHTVATRFRAYGEEAMFLARRELGREGFVDVGGAVHLWRDLAIAGSYSHVGNAGPTVVSGTVPHPLDFDRHRTAGPESLELPYRERVTHLSLSWRMPLREALDVAVFVGPTFFNLTHAIVTDVRAAEAGGPPFSEVVVEAVTGTHTGNAVGGHGGLDVTYMLTPTVGFGYFVRFSRGFVDTPAGGGSTRLVEVGGLHTGGGLRLRF